MQNHYIFYLIAISLKPSCDFTETANCLNLTPSATCQPTVRHVSANSSARVSQSVGTWKPIVQHV